MDFTNIDKKYYCGIDLHSETMYICIMNKAGNVLYHREHPIAPKEFLKIIQPYRKSIAIGVESTYNWYWLSDLCDKEKIPFFIGHALYMKDKSKNKNDRIDSKKLANLLRTNSFPLAYPYPKEMRATRDLLRRRTRFVSIRSGVYAHMHCLFSQQGITNIEPKHVKNKTNRKSFPQSFDDPDISLSISSDIELVEKIDTIVPKLEKQILAQAKYHDKTAFNILISTTGIGPIIALTILYEIHDINRFHSPQQLSSYSRLVLPERNSAGKTVDRKNRNIGNPYLKWAFTEIIIHAARYSPKIKKYYEHLISKHGKTKAKFIIAHKFAVAIFYMLKNKKLFDENKFVSGIYTNSG
jgi:transposase